MCRAGSRASDLLCYPTWRRKLPISSSGVCTNPSSGVLVPCKQTKGSVLCLLPLRVSFIGPCAPALAFWSSPQCRAWPDSPPSAFWAPSVFIAASATRCGVENGCGGRADGFLAASLAFSWLKECPERSTVWTGISLPAIQPASATLSLQFVTHIWYVFSTSLRARLPGNSSNCYLSAAESCLAFGEPTHGRAVGLCHALGGSAGPPKQRGVNQQRGTPYHQPPFSTRGGLLL